VPHRKYTQEHPCKDNRKDALMLGEFAAKDSQMQKLEADV
jgi:hypothetical protein